MGVRFRVRVRVGVRVRVRGVCPHLRLGGGDHTLGRALLEELDQLGHACGEGFRVR